MTAYRSFILRTLFPPRFLRDGSIGLGNGFTNLTGGGSLKQEIEAYQLISLIHQTVNDMTYVAK